MPLTQSKYMAMALYEWLDTHTLFLNKFLKIFEGLCAGVRAFFVLIGTKHAVIGTNHSEISPNLSGIGTYLSGNGTNCSENGTNLSEKGTNLSGIGTNL